jgi:hypothetical protein
MPPRRAVRAQARDVQIEPTGDDATLLSFHQAEAAPRQRPPRQARQSLSGTKRRTTTPPPSVERRAAATAAANLLSDYASSDEDNDDETTGTFDRLPAKRPSSAARPSVWFDEEVVVIPPTPTITGPPPPPLPTTVAPASAVPAVPPPPVPWLVPAAKVAPEPLQVASATRLVSAAPDTREGLAAQQETMRSATRSVLDELRRGEIPFYDADKNDAARTVIIDQPVFTALHQDSAFEFQDANRMPWVPRAPNAVVDRVRNWHVVETLRELDQRKKPWYTMVSMVAGFLKIDVDQLVVPAPGTASANAARPTRNSVRGVGFGGGGGDDGGGGGGGGGGASQVGLTGGSATTALAGNLTVGRDDGGFNEPGYADAKGNLPGPGLGEAASRAAAAAKGKDKKIVVPENRPSPFATPPGSDAAGGAAAGGAAAGAAAAGAPADPPARPLTLEEQVTKRVDLTADGMRAFSRGQFADFRDARRNTEWYETSNQEAALKLSRDLRVAGAQAQAWITRPVATGIYYLNNNYVAARDEAWMLITSRADQLSAVPIEAFIAEDERDPVQARVRIQFAKLIATLFNFHRYNSSRFVKLAHDAANHAAQSTDILSYFVNRITYNTQTGRFADTGARAAINHQPAWLRRPLGVPSLPSSAACFDPLLARPPPSRASASMLISRW